MNLYFRLFLTLLKALRGPRVRPGEAVELELRVLPTDLDLNGHMNNGRYLTVMDLGLATLFIRSGFARMCLNKGWRPMSGGSLVHFRRGLTLFQRYTLRLTLVGWDEFWSYCHFEFIRGGEVCATGVVKGATVSGKGRVPTSEVYPALGYDGASLPLPEEVVAWIAADRLVGARAKASAAHARSG